MAKLIIISIVLVSFAVPVYFSTRPSPRRTLRRVQWIMFGFTILWAYLCLHWYPTLVELQ
jgi:hypothetical protein